MIEGLSFGAPWLGGLALLAIPALIAIHFLQLPSRPVAASTLFLLERLSPESKGGRRLQRLRNSLPLWLQLLIALLLAWLLSAPRWLRPESVQTLVVVLDSSISMQAFHEQLQPDKRLAPLERAAARTEWILMESDPAAPQLYRGEDLSALSAIVNRWTPRLGHHDPAPVLRLAQTLVPGSGDILYITDRPALLPPGIMTLGIGRPLENVGFSGVRTTLEDWEALVRNYGQQPQTFAWWTESKSARTEPRPITLQPGEAQTVKGAFPPEGRLRVVLECVADGFEVDNALPLIRPQEKPLRIALPPEQSALTQWLGEFSATLPHTSVGASPADLRFQRLKPGAAPSGEPGSIVFVRTTGPTAPTSGIIAAENHPLVEGLNWQGLLVSGVPERTPHQDDTPLVWIGGKPLIYLQGDQLIVNFDPTYSNATRQPAFILLLQRYAEHIRASLPAPESLNVETHQLLPLTGEQSAFTQTPPSDTPLRAPALPQFFTLSEMRTDGPPRLRMDAAAYFADAREADFRAAAAFDPIPSMVDQRREQNSERDASSPFWLLAIAALMLGNWGWQERRRDA